MMARLERPSEAAHALGFFEGATSRIQGVRPLTAEAESYLRASGDETTAAQTPCRRQALPPSRP